MDDIITIVRSLEESGLLVDGATETVKHEIKKQEGGLLDTIMAPMVASLIETMDSWLTQPVASLLVNAISWKEEQKKDKKVDFFHY